MARRIGVALIALVASAAGIGLAVVAGSAGAATPAAMTTTTLGSTTGTPSQNICLTGLDCTYVPFNSAAAPGLQVPFDGTVTSFSVNSGSATGAVQLRVLRPAGNGQYTGAGTSSLQNLAGGPQTFTVSMTVKAGDVLAVDNSSSALLFDTSTSNPVFTAYYQPATSGPSGLPDGSTAVPGTNKPGYRLLLSATVVGSTTTASTSTTGATTVTTTSTGGTTTVTRTVTVTGRPVIGNPTQSRSSWRVGQGTTFAFGLSTNARITLTFRRHVGRKVRSAGALTFNGHPGTVRHTFKGRVAGKRLVKGRYTVVITASNATGHSRSVSLKFRVTG
jgi:hypothetical protein